MLQDYRAWRFHACRGFVMKSHRATPAEFAGEVSGRTSDRDVFRERLAHVLEHHVPTHLEQTYGDIGRGRLFAERATGRVLTRSEIDELADTFLVSEPGAFLSVIERLGLSRLEFPDFYRAIVSPISRALGEMWSDDRAGFLAVSIATERMRLAIDTLYPDFEVSARHASRRALITCHEGSLHNFGAFLLAKSFVFSDWLVESRDWHDASGSPLGAVARSRFDFVGLSVGTTSDAPAVAKVIAALRAKSANPQVVIGIGGPGPVLDPDAYAASGADFMAFDAFDAVEDAGRRVAAVLQLS
jgi:methanogenic corrinoid protein MtbC1